jgi:hypothetical protein
VREWKILLHHVWVCVLSPNRSAATP